MIEGRITNLRAQEAADAEYLYVWRNDPEVRRHLNRRYPWTRLYAESWQGHAASSPPAFTDAHFAIETRDGRTIGFIDLQEQHVEDRNATFGMMIGEKDCWSQGYGADALRTLLGFAFGEMNLHRVGLEVHADNARGIASYRKCGFREEGVARQVTYRRGGYRDHVVMSILRHEFLAMEGTATP